MDIREYLRASVWSREDVDHFLDPQLDSWARYDGLTGYVLDDIVVRDGVDGARTINSYDDLGPAASVDPSHRASMRRLVNYRDQPCRVNTYGDSFTQCHQVSDGETWQEILAAHLGEPIRNFGVGGFGVYQAFCRMRAIEPASAGVDYVVLNICDDDHIRNLDAARWFRIDGFRRAMGPQLRSMLHANPWTHLRLDPSTGVFVEQPNALATPESLYAFTDPDYLVATYENDPIVMLDCLRRGLTVADVAPLEELAVLLGRSVDLRAGDVAAAADELLLAYGLASTLATLKMVREFLDGLGKQLMVLLSYGQGSVVEALDGRERFDQLLVDDLRTHDDLVVDGLRAHVDDYASFSVSADAYCRRYYNGHYSPAGNHFFAYAVKDTLVSWLDPKPIAYGGGDPIGRSAGRLA